MPQNYLAKTFISLQATMSPNVMQELSKELRMLQKIDLQQLSKSLKQAQYFQKHSAEITRMQKTYSQLRDIAKPLIEKYPQLEEIERTLPDLPISSTVGEIDNEEAQDVCIAAQKFVSNLLERGVIQDETPNTTEIDNLVPDISFSSSQISPQALLMLARSLHKALLSLLSNPNNVLMTALSNFITLITVALYIWSVLKN